MPKTIYHQIAQDIYHQINKGAIKPGAMIPSMSQLASQYNTSRMTVRKALSLLINAGYIISVPGKGHFVSEPQYDQFTMRFNELELIKGQLQEVKLLEVNIVAPPFEAIKHLQLTKKSKTVVIKRLLCHNEQPIAYDFKYFPYDRGKPIVEKEIRYAPFPEIVARHEELFSVKNELKITASIAQTEEKDLLQVKAGSPLLVLEQKLFSIENTPIGWGKIYCLPSSYQLYAVSALHNNQYKISEYK